jgi:hypothetical protein
MERRRVRTPPLLECVDEGFDFEDLLFVGALQQELGDRPAYLHSFERIC